MLLLNRLLFIICLVNFSLVAHSQSASHNNEQEFQLLEASVLDIHQAFTAKRLTCKQLVQAYLKRIKHYDQSTGLNAIVQLNPEALQIAEQLDKEFRVTESLRELHCIPMIVKDNYDTIGMQTTAGSIALKGSMAPDDAYQIAALKRAGAIVLAKSNMAEWAFSNVRTESSIAGITRNAYNLKHLPAGSSGGTAAAVAANFGAIGLGTDTGNSIRGPSSHAALVGIRSTMGLASRDGIIPLFLRNDIGGPMCRSVADVAKVLGVITGYDKSDPITRYGRGRIPSGYMQYLDKNGLAGARIGVLRQVMDEQVDPQVVRLFNQALRDLEKQGAQIVDNIIIRDLHKMHENIWCSVFRHDVENYFKTLGALAPVKSLAQVVESGQYSGYIKESLQEEAGVQQTDPRDRFPPCLDLYVDLKAIRLRGQVLKTMDVGYLDAIVYPSWNFLPRKIGEEELEPGDNSQYIAPHTGLPAITVPMGYGRGDLPAGLQILGRPFQEGLIIKLAYSYEQATKHRHPPDKFPPLSSDRH